MNPFVLPAAGAGAAVIAVVYLLTRPVGKSGAPGTKDTPPKPEYTPAQLVPKPSSKAVTAQRIKTLGDLFDKVWPDVSGRPGPMPKWIKEVALAQAAAEFTGYGQAWDGDMAGSWNIASYQAGNAQGGNIWRRVDHKDSRPMPDGSQKEYTTAFRYYQDGDGRTAAENGAWDFLTAIWSDKRFGLSKALDAGDVLAYALLGYAHHYFEGFNLSDAGQAAYADTIKRLVALGVPTRKAGETPEMVAGRIALYAGSMGRALPEIAHALGHEKVYATVPADVIAFKPAFVKASAPAVSGVEDLEGLEHVGLLYAEWQEAA